MSPTLRNGKGMAGLKRRIAGFSSVKTVVLEEPSLKGWPATDREDRE
jgi:hypothetical protein